MIIAQRTIPALRPPDTLNVPKPGPAPSVETTVPPTSDSSGFISSEDNFTTILGDANILEIIQKLIVFAFIIAGLLSAIFIFVGGVSFILSGGNDEKIKKAVNTIRYAIVGLIITIFSFTFVTIVGRFFGLNLLDYISWEMVKNSIENVIQTTKGKSSGIPRR